MIKIIKENISLIITALLCVALAMFEPLIFQLDNITNISRQASLIAIFAVAQSIVLIIKGLDLSQGGTITIISVCVAILSSHLGILMSIFVGLTIGSIIGSINGILVSMFKVSPFVVTLGIGFLLQGAALVLSNGQPVYNVPANFSYLGWHEIFGVPMVVYIILIIALALDFYLTKIIYGRYLFAIGSNEKASYLSGIKVLKHKVIAYGVSGLVTSIGAVVLASRINGGHPTEGSNTALQSVAAAVIGGVSLFGGKGTIIGVILGSLLLAFISNALNILNFSSYYQQVMIGVIIIFAVIIDKLKTTNNEE